MDDLEREELVVVRVDRHGKVQARVPVARTSVTRAHTRENTISIAARICRHADGTYRLYTILRSCHSRMLHILVLRLRTVVTISRVILDASLAEYGVNHLARRTLPWRLNRSIK